MHLSNKQLGDFLCQLDRATSFDTLFSRLDQQAKQLGADGVIYFLIPRIALDFKQNYTPIFKGSNKNNRAYLKHYLKERLDQHDYIIKQIKHQRQGPFMPIDWWSEVAENALSQKEIDVITTARTYYQMRNGITFPTLSNTTGIAGVSFIFNQNNNIYAQLKAEIMDDLSLLAREFHKSVISTNYQDTIFTRPLLKPFSYTEDKVFRKLLLTGKSASCIANEIGISTKGVESAIHRLRIKLAGTTPEGIPKITKDRLIHYGSVMGVPDWIN